MLRIDYENGPGSTRLKLEGKLAGPWVDEVARIWFDLIGEKPAHEVTVDLSEVTFVDRDGKRLLRWMLDRGANLCDGHLMTKYIVDQVRQDAEAVQPTGGR